MWQKSKELVDKISSVIDVEKIIVLGSFTTEKQRPADVDFQILVKTKDEKEDWSTDIQFVPNNKFGEEIIKDAEKWMIEKYGEGNFEIFQFDKLK
jgi:hypothetical protein